MRYRSISVGLCLLAVIAACGTEPRAYCDRLSSCTLQAIDADTCVQRVTAERDALSSPGRDEFELFLASCLVQPSCDTFFVCLETFPSIGLADQSAPSAARSVGLVPEAPDIAKRGTDGM